MNTTLTYEQHDRLDRLEREHPDAKVVRWSEHQHGPVVTFDGKRHAVSEAGRLIRERTSPLH